MRIRVILWEIFRKFLGMRGCRYATPKIQPSTCAIVRSDAVGEGFRNVARLPSRSACESQAAME
jgi:hypothetical protein